MIGVQGAQEETNLHSADALRTCSPSTKRKAETKQLLGGGGVVTDLFLSIFYLLDAPQSLNSTTL